MIILLNASPDQMAAQNPNVMEELVSGLLQASTRGSHLVVINRKLCEWAHDQLGFSNREKAQLSRIKSAFAQRGSLVGLAQCILEVEISDRPLEEYAPHKYRIGHTSLLRGRYLEDPCLLVEHIENDGEILNLILNETRRVHPVKDFSYELLHGGGADIASCLRVEVPNQRVVVTVVDSDKMAPCDRSSATKRNLDREAQRQTFVGMVCETPCKEAENYVPLYILEKHRRKICPEFADFQVLNQLLTDQDVSGPSDCLWLFFDIKRGVETQRLVENGNQELVSWVSNKYGVDPDRLAEISLSGFGDSILRSFLGCGEAVKDFVLFMRGEYWRVNFRDFFETIYWYFAAEKKPRSV